MNANPILLQRKYTRIICLFAERANISLAQALDYFMFSNTYILMREGIGDSHCLSDEYLVNELLEDYQLNQICNERATDKNHAISVSIHDLMNEENFSPTKE